MASRAGGAAGLGRSRRRSGLRVAVGTAAALCGIALGLVVAGLLNRSNEPAAYRPFFAGLRSDRVEDIRQDGPVLIPDPRGGDRSFYLDLAGGDLVALHVVPPGESSSCLVQFDREAQHYENCRGEPVERGSLARFPVETRTTEDEDEAVFVDLRELLPPPGQSPSG